MLKDEDELKEVWGDTLKGIEANEYFIQEVIPAENKTVSVTVFAHMGEVRAFWMGIKLREHPITFGTATCCKSGYEEDMLQQSKRLIKELNFSGVCEIEWLRDSRDGLAKLIEINARTWLWVALAAKSGVDYPNMIFDYIYKGVIPQAVDYKKDVVWLNIFTDLAYSLLGILKGKYKIKEVVKSYRKFHEATWQCSDPLPFIKYALLMGRFLKSR